MSVPKLHHYVPQFYLERFAERGQLWVFDKATKATFPATPKRIAAEKHFYRVPEFVGTDSDALILEKALSEIEGEASEITELWFKRLEAASRGGKVLIGKYEKWLMSLYIALQYLRTAEQREMLAAFVRGTLGQDVSKDEERNLHAFLLAGNGNTLYEKGAVQMIADGIYRYVWMFGRNETTTPFLTSDNPVVVRSRAPTVTLKLGILDIGAHITFPLSPSVTLFCYERAGWPELKKFANHLSPVSFTTQLVNGENWGQMFMARRFVISPRDPEQLKKFGCDFLVRHREICEAGRDCPYDHDR